MLRHITSSSSRNLRTLLLQAGSGDEECRGFCPSCLVQASHHADPLVRLSSSASSVVLLMKASFSAW